MRNMLLVVRSWRGSARIRRVLGGFGASPEALLEGTEQAESFFRKIGARYQSPVLAICDDQEVIWVKSQPTPEDIEEAVFLAMGVVSTPTEKDPFQEGTEHCN